MERPGPRDVVLARSPPPRMPVVRNCDPYAPGATLNSRRKARGAASERVMNRLVKSRIRLKRPPGYTNRDSFERLLRLRPRLLPRRRARLHPVRIRPQLRTEVA